MGTEIIILEHLFYEKYPESESTELGLYNNNTEIRDFLLMTRPVLWELAQKIWRHPREVIRQVVAYDPWLGQRQIILVLSAVSGLLALPQGIEMMLLEFVLNLILLIASIHSMAWLLWITGKPLGGKAKISELCAAMTWPMIPAIWSCVLAIPLLGTALWGDLLQGLFYLISFHLMVQTVAEVQGFSGWRSFLNQLLALILSLLPLLFFWNQITTTFQALNGF